MAFKTKTLKSGLRIVVVPMPNSLTTTVLVLTETGSKYETKRISGISHFLEHMCFKGTEKRPVSRAISEELDGLGALYNAFTGHEYTGYFAQAEARHFGKMLDVVSDIYLNSTFPKTELEKERGVIIGEIEMYEDIPQRDVGDLFTDLLYGDQPAGWNIAGTKESVRAISRADMVAYKKKHYVAAGTVVVVAGKCDPSDVFKAVSKAFKTAPTDGKHGKKRVKERQLSPAVAIKHKKTNQTHFVLGVRTFDVYHPIQPVLSVLAGVLGGGMSSRLFERVREEMGAGYYVGADNDRFTDHGLFAAYAGVENARAAEVIAAVLEEMRALKDTLVPNAELEKVKNYLAGNLLTGLETSSARAQFYGGAAMMRKELKTPQEKAANLRKVSAEDVQNAAREIFKNESLNLALIGPFREKDKKRFEKILSF